MRDGAAEGLEPTAPSRAPYGGPPITLRPHVGQRPAFVWPPEADTYLLARRVLRESWTEIGKALGVSRKSARNRADILFRSEDFVDLHGGEEGKGRIGAFREPLPPGDPLSWELLLSLTPSLQGARYV
jgi:hypothetical protein